MYTGGGGGIHLNYKSLIFFNFHRKTKRKFSFANRNIVYRSTCYRWISHVPRFISTGFTDFNRTLIFATSPSSTSGLAAPDRVIFTYIILNLYYCARRSCNSYRIDCSRTDKGQRRSLSARAEFAAVSEGGSRAPPLKCL